MKNGKAKRQDGIPAKVWKSMDEEGLDILCDLLSKNHDQGKILDAWRESTILPIYKEKRDTQDCANNQGIKLMSHTMKI